MKPWGYYFINTATGRPGNISAIALNTMSAEEKSAWDKLHVVQYPIDIEGQRIRTAAEIGKENSPIIEALTKMKPSVEVGEIVDEEPTETEEPVKEIKPKKQKDGKEKGK